MHKNCVEVRERMGEKRDSFSEANPVILFLYFMVVIATTMLVSHPVILAFSFLGAFCYQVLLSGVRKTFRQQLFCYIPLFLIVAIINPAFNHYGVTVLFYLKTGPVTVEALVYGVVLASMLWTAFVWFANVNRVMTTDKFVYLFGRLTPVLSLVLSMVFRFVPRYKKRLQVVRAGQKCLGKDSYAQNIFSRIRSGVSEISMLVTWALENGMDTADSMQARGYGTAKRTSYAVFRFTRRDAEIAVFAIAVYAVAIIGFFNGNAFSQYNPLIIIGGLPLTWQSVVTYVLWLVFVMLPVELRILERRNRR